MGRRIAAWKLVHAAAVVAVLLPVAVDADADDRAGGPGGPAGGGVAVVVDGPHGEEVAGWLEDTLGGPDAAGDPKVFRSALRSGGAPPLRVAAGNAVRDVQLVSSAHAALRQTGVGSAVLVDLHDTAHATRIHVWMVEAVREGAAVDRQITLSPPGSAIEEARAVLALVRTGPVREAAPAPTPAPPPAPAFAPSTPPSAVATSVAPAPQPSAGDAAPDADKGAPAAPSDRKASLLSVQAALGVGMRHFSYVQRFTSTLRPYDLSAAPMASVSGVVYPLASTRMPVVRDLGITGDYARAFGISSQDSTGASVGTTWQSFDLGATERIPLARVLVANVAIAYGGSDFQFDQNLPNGMGQLPSVAYRFLRAGADVRYTILPSLSAFAGGSYLDVLSTGYVSALFPRESVGGVEGHLGAAWSLARSWELSLSASYARFFYSMNPVPGDSTAAGGALDEQSRVMAGFAYLM